MSAVTVQKVLDAAVLDWGDVPTWVTAVATIAALVFAGIAAVHTGRLLDREAARDARAEWRDTRSQADSVAAWVAYLEWVVPVTAERGPSQERRQGWRILVRNASQLPVYEVEVQLEFGESGTTTIGPLFKLPVVPPSDEPTPMALEEGYDFSAARAAMRFRDTSGNRWSRAADGTLSAVPT